jgi:hydrogenase nickel incorporation protein HypA/HybF
MHEASIARMILRQVLLVESDHPGMSAAAAAVEVGPLSGVEPLLLLAAFEQVVVELPRAKLPLTVREVALTITCQQCGGESIMENFQFTCGHCGSSHVQVTRGDGIQLLHVDLQEQNLPGDAK